MTPTNRAGFPLTRWGCWLAAMLVVAIGCTTPAVNTAEGPSLDELVDQSARQPTMVRDMARAQGTRFVKVESVALVTNLDNTGSDPPPSADRAMLLAEMRARDTKDPNHVLMSPRSSLVYVEAYLPPGVQEGDRVDVFVRTPMRSQTTSLRGGWLMQTRLKQMAVLGGQVRSGHVLALAEGPVLIDSVFGRSSDGVQHTRGRVLGGATVLKSRTLALVPSSEYQSVRNASMIGAAINARFHSYERGNRKGAATPRRDNLIELTVHPRYRKNVVRYMQVVGAIPVGESAADQLERLRRLERELLHPATAADAAIQLEAIGKDGARVLAMALDASDPAVRFYAAEALAYLDDPRAAAVLADSARKEPAFRWNALTALAAMDDMAAFDSLIELLRVESVETRYGAFRALRVRGPNAPIVKGETLGTEFSFHVIDSDAEPLIHFARTRRPEVVLFGRDQQFSTPMVLFAGKEIIVRGNAPNEVRVSRFAPGQPDAHETCTADVAEVVRALVRVGATYAEVFEIVDQAKQKQCLASRVAIEAVPRGGRTYRPDPASMAGEGGASVRELASPMPEMFFSEGQEGNLEVEASADSEEENLEESELAEAQQSEGFLGRMLRWPFGD